MQPYRYISPQGTPKGPSPITSCFREAGVNMCNCSTSVQARFLGINFFLEGF